MLPRLVKLTRTQRAEWDDTRAALMYYASAFTHIFYTLMNADDDYVVMVTDDDDAVPTAATDGKYIIINANKFFNYPLMERLFIVAHEILHNILNHIPLLYTCRRLGRVTLSDGRSLPYDEDALQMALDYVVNAILVDAKIGTLPKNGLFDLRIATHLESVLDVYAKAKPVGVVVGGKGPAGSASGGFDRHLEPGALEGKPPVQAMDERNPEEWRTVIQAAMEAAMSQGKLPAGLQRLFELELKSEVDWTDVVKGIFARRLGSDMFNWRKPDRKLIVRDIWAPSRAGHGCDLVVLASDTSGSITQPILGMWYGTIGEILEQVNPKKIILIWCDAEIGRVDEIEEASDIAALKKKGAPGGGGTDFRPVFDYITDHRLDPEALIFLTDGYGTFPKRAPRYPVVWGSIALAADRYPFGDVVMIPPPKP